MEKGLYKKLFLSTFQLSACTFGGGFVIIPLMRRKFVRELHWINEQEMMDITAIAQSSPGAIAVNASVMTGYQIAGFPGAMITIVTIRAAPLIKARSEYLHVLLFLVTISTSLYLFIPFTPDV